MSIRDIKQKFGQIRTRLSPFGWKIINDWSFSLSSLIAYYLLISLLPLVLCIFAVTSLIFGKDTNLQNEIRNRLVEAFPQQILSDIVDALVKSLSEQAGFIFIISFIVAIFTSSRLFIGIDDVLTIIYRIRERRILDQNIYAIKMLLTFILLMPIIIISSSLSAILKQNETFYHFLITVFSGIFAFILFDLIYYFVPQRKMNWSHTWCGALFAAVGLQILILLFPIYVHRFMNDYVGQLGFIIIALILFYLFGLLFVIGAQINSYFFDNIQPLPIGLGTCLSEFAGHELVQLIDENSQSNNSMSTLIEGLNPQN